MPAIQTAAKPEEPEELEATAYFEGIDAAQAALDERAAARKRGDGAAAARADKEAADALRRADLANLALTLRERRREARRANPAT